jgi:hypothetical protein
VNRDHKAEPTSFHPGLLGSHRGHGRYAFQ